MLLQSLVLTPYKQYLFSDFGLEEELGVDEQVAWETPLDGSVDPEGDV